MKKVIALIFGVLFSFDSFGITEYKPEEELYIWAESGLNLRERPDFKSEVLAKMPFGEKIICKGRKSGYDYEHNSLKIIDEIKISDNKVSKIEMEGNWVKISFRDIDGYVFDAYLSRFKPLEKEKEAESLFDYFKKGNTYVYLEKKDSTLEYGHDKIVFSNGIFLTNNYHSGAYGFQMIITKFSKEEAWLFIRYLEKYIEGVIQDQSGNINIGKDMGGYKIETHKDITIISGEWAC